MELDRLRTEFRKILDITPIELRKKLEEETARIAKYEGNREGLQKMIASGKEDISKLNMAVSSLQPLIYFSAHTQLPGLRTTYMPMFEDRGSFRVNSTVAPGPEDLCRAREHISQTSKALFDATVETLSRFQTNLRQEYTSIRKDFEPEWDPRSEDGEWDTAQFRQHPEKHIKQVESFLNTLTEQRKSKSLELQDMESKLKQLESEISVGKGYIKWAGDGSAPSQVVKVCPEVV